MRALPALLPLAALIALSGCGEDPRTQVMLVVDAECAVVSRTSTLRVRATVDGTVPYDVLFTVRPDGTGWPRRIALVPLGGDASRRYLIEVEALVGSVVIASGAVRSGYVAEKTLMLRVVLESACILVTCAEGESCMSSACSPIPEIAPASLPPWESATALCTNPDVDAGGPDAGRDAGPLDAGGDAGGDVDGGPGDAGGDAGTDGGPPVGPVEVAAGAGHSCARLADGTVRCWGRNGSRQIGDGSTVATQSTPQLAVGLADAASIGLGDAHSCAVRAGGTAVCWGSNVSGQVGNGDTLTFGGINMPTPVMDLTDAVVVRGGLAHTCASVSDDTMKCWGRNSAGQLGDATVTRRTTPVNVWLLSDVAAIATGSEHSCAVLGDGTVRCWGENGRGQLGDGGRTDANMPVPVTSMAGAIDLAAGSTHTCALRMDGSVWCWGENTSGQLGTDMGGLGTPDSLVPVQVVRLDDAIAIAAGFDSTCAIRSGGAAVCWGDNTDGRLGTGTAASREEGPTAVSALTGVTSIAVGGGHGCAVADPAATVYCWGTNGSGQLGTGGTPASSTVPIPVDL